MGFPRIKKGRQGRWPQALILFIMPITLVFCIRWLLIEPFVIPSESMVPTLLVHDHIFVNKISYGIKHPFGDGWIWMFNKPQRGDVVVFRYPENRDVFFVKRLIGLPGDHLQIQNGQITVNGEPWRLELSLDSHDNDPDKIFTYFYEKVPGDQRIKPQKSEGHEIRLMASGIHIDPDMRDIIVPKDSYFMMGDNRDQSSDSRFWGFVNRKLIIGKAVAIWLSCSETLESTPMMCDPAKLRVDRIFKGVQNP